MAKKKPKKTKAPGLVWTDEMDGILRKMSSAGATRAQISRHLTIMVGKEVTRNAVSGRSFRIGATSSRALNRSTKTKLKNTTVYGWQRVAPVVDEIEVKTPSAPSTPSGCASPRTVNKKSATSKKPETKNKKYHVDHAKNIIRRKPIIIPTDPGRPGGCQFINGEPAKRDFCGKPTVQGSKVESGSWCAEHYPVVYERIIRIVAKDGEGFVRGAVRVQE